MMRRAPFWFTNKENRERFRQLWPWGVGLLMGALYQYNPLPFDDLMSGGVSSVRKPLLGFFERVERYDMDPEVIALELPPDQLFGPLPMKQQVFFALQALEEENELGDHYITRMIIDQADFGLDPPALGDAFVEAGGGDLFREAIRRYRNRDKERIKFFTHDQFLRMASVACSHRVLAEEFLDKTQDAIPLLLTAMREAYDDYSRHFGLRTLVLLSMAQKKDGTVEKTILQNPDGLRHLIEMYAKSSGDPHETRYVTMLLSSILRTTKDGPSRFLAEGGMEALVSGLNVTMYKAVPQHVRLFNDIMASKPKEVRAFLARTDDIVPVMLGVMGSYPEYKEMQAPLCRILREGAATKAPFEMMQYGALSTFSREVARYEPGGLEEKSRGPNSANAVSAKKRKTEAVAATANNAPPKTEDRHVSELFDCIAHLAKRILDDKECQKFFDHSPEVQYGVRDMKKFVEERSLRP
eukprot:PhM_4_TR4157/c0_g1_i1/m.73999